MKSGKVNLPEHSEYESKPNGPSMSLLMRKLIQTNLSRAYTIEFGTVLSYDHDTRRADIQKLSDDGAMPVPNVPVASAQGIHLELRSIADGDEVADVGFLLYPRSDSRKSFDSRNPAAPASKRVKHGALGPLFVPFDFPYPGDPETPQRGWIEIFKDGSIEIRTTDLRVLAPGSDGGSLLNVIRRTDTGDGGLSPGAIVGPGSSIFRSE